MLKKSKINTPFGPMIALTSQEALFLLQFADQPNIDRTIQKIASLLQTTVVEGINKPIQLITKELEEYFSGRLTKFTTPITSIGTEFQKKVWHKLMSISFGQTITYQELACHIKNERAHRAVGNANAKNLLALIIPCHRVIQKNNKIGGYAGGVNRKEWLLKHESKVFKLIQ